MIFRDVLPAASLRHLVQYYRIRHFIIPDFKLADKKPFPARPEQCITFYPRGSEITEIVPLQHKVVRPRSVLSGQYTCRINRGSQSTEFLMIQVVFIPGMLHKLTGIPFTELLNQDIDLETVFPHEARATNERLSSAVAYVDMIAIVESFLLAIATKQKEIYPADKVFQLIAVSPQKYSLSWLAGQACLSPRQFERKAQLCIGVSPQMLARITRFSKTYEMKMRKPQLDWLSIAVACGYHDYQHLVRDYKEFAFTTPNNIFREEFKSVDRFLGITNYDF